MNTLQVNKLIVGDQRTPKILKPKTVFKPKHNGT